VVIKNKHECQRGVSSKLRAQQRRNHGKQTLCGHEERTTDWYWKSVKNVPGVVAKERAQVGWLRGVESVMRFRRFNKPGPQPPSSRGPQAGDTLVYINVQKASKRLAAAWGFVVLCTEHWLVVRFIYLSSSVCVLSTYLKRRVHSHTSDNIG